MAAPAVLRRSPLRADIDGVLIAICLAQNGYTCDLALVSRDPELWSYLAARPVGRTVPSKALTWLHAAAALGHEDRVRFLCSPAVHAPLNAVNVGNLYNRERGRGLTPLGYAIEHARAGVVDALWALGARKVENPSDSYPNVTALGMAAQFARTDIVAGLLSFGADPDEVHELSQDGMTPLHVAVKMASEQQEDDVKWSSNAAVATALLNSGANVNAVSSVGNTPLHIALEHYSMAYRVLRMVVILLDAGADVMIADSRGRTPLHIVCMARSYSDSHSALKFELCFKLASVSGASIEAVDDRGLTPPEYARAEGDFEVERLLVSFQDPPSSGDEGSRGSR